MKTGRPQKIGEKERAEILENLEVGASLKDAAGAVGVDNATVYRLRRADPAFAKGVRQAVKKGKLKLIRTVATAETWQAAAWMLERRWGRQFGRKDTVNIKSRQEHIHQIRQDVAAVASDPEAMRAVQAYARRLSALELANGNGQAKPKTNGEAGLN